MSGMSMELVNGAHKYNRHTTETLIYVTSTIVSTLYYQRPVKLLCLVCNSAWVFSNALPLDAPLGFCTPVITYFSGAG